MRKAPFSSTILETEGLITPIDLYYVVAQLQMPELIQPDDWVLLIGEEVERLIELTLEELRKLPSARAFCPCSVWCEKPCLAGGANSRFSSSCCSVVLRS
jgi:hypothetical protein